ncbi:hypothetical protein DKX38_021886 [Salix brachista]|uniref:RING-type E3 ubiquitin transferase n=1 Tax=Salix brachista TaxID=2182728 RepID=A0A5N5KAH6_9ROSI|nr:hypothetical protein DKX38_021886 [Salix brachista]
MDLSLVALFMLVLVGHGALLDDPCPESRCAKDGPAIRFPFRLEDKNQPDHCGYPGFELSCTDTKQTLLQLPNSVKLYVDKIDYASQLIIARDPDECFPKQLRNFNMSVSLFESTMGLSDYSVFNCTSRKGDGYDYRYLDCLSGPGYIYAYTSDYSISYTDLTNCTKLYNLSSIPSEIVGLGNTLHLNWSTPDSGRCERRGKFCRRNSSASLHTKCYDKPKSKKEIWKKIVPAVATVGSVLLLLVAHTKCNHSLVDHLKLSINMINAHEALALRFTAGQLSQKNLSLEMDLSLLCLLLLLLVSHGVGLEDMCREERCKKHGPVIRFPFRIKGKQPDHCGYPGFDLSCTDRKETLLELPTSVKLYVNEIDYALQLIIARDPDECLPKQLRNFSLSRSPFGSGYKGLSNYSFFNCTSSKGDGYNLDCLSGPGYIYAYTSDYSISYTDLTNCTKLYNLSSIPSEIFEMKNILYLNWSMPGCQQCEKQRKFCKLKKNSRASSETDCYDKPKSKKDIKKKIEAAGENFGIFNFFPYLSTS